MSQSQQSSPSSSPVWPVHIEVRLKQSATARFDTIRDFVCSYITSSVDRLCLPSNIEGWEQNPTLASSVERIYASESTCPQPCVSITQMSLQIHVYQPTDSDAFEEFATGGSSARDDEGVMAATVCELPNRGWEGLWESLIYSDDIKSKLLNYIYATIIFSDAGVDFNVVAWNRIILLHGPPGTGKTSLCRALAQKLSIRLSHRYSHARVLEINSHSLFSKWFSESGKLVQRLFGSVMEMAEDEDTFVIVLIDEVESLTAARAGAVSGTEPSDALRVVNALLTQLDKLKHKKNALVMATSNLVNAIDSAFVDRADIVQYIDLPPKEAVYEILRTCLSELMARRLVDSIDVPSLTQALIYESTKGSKTLPASDTHGDAKEKSKNVALRLMALAEKCRAQGMSGRSLRRLPVLAQARYGSGISYSYGTKAGQVNGVHGMLLSDTDIESWLSAMENVVEDQGIERARMA